MNISGIRPGAGFYDYNTIKSDEASMQRTADVEPIPAVREGTEEDRQELALQSDREGRTDNGAREFAERYQPDVSYELKGSESDLMSLDVEKAISDMRKDQVLQQYQFFVGESQAEEILATAKEKENFSL